MPEYNPQYYWLVVPRGGGSSPVPTMVSVSPDFSKTTGGDPLTFTGTNFSAGCLPTIDGVVQDSVVVVNATTITCLSTPHDAGAVVAGVINVDGYGSNTVPFTYVQDAYIIAQNGNRLVTQSGNPLITQGEPVAPYVTPLDVLGVKLVCEFTGEDGSYDPLTGTCTDLIGGGFIGQDTPGLRPVLGSTPGGRVVWSWDATTKLSSVFGAQFVIAPLAALPSNAPPGERLFYFIEKATVTGTNLFIFTTGNQSVLLSGALGKMYADTNVGGYEAMFSDSDIGNGTWNRVIIVCNQVTGITRMWVNGVVQADTIAAQWGQSTEWGGYGVTFGNGTNGLCGRFGFAYTAGTFPDLQIAALDAALLSVIG